MTPSPRADLHLHTSASDGLLTPSELVQLAQRQALDIIAITDHDTTDGLSGLPQPVAGGPVVIPGIELSTSTAGDDVHLLGYFIRPDDVALQAYLSAFREERVRRARRMVERLAALNMPLAWEQVLAQAGDGAIGRPHIARALVQAGYVESVQEAFDRYLGNDGPAYVPRTRPSPQEAIQLLHRAGGVAVLAHPGLVTDYAPLIHQLVAAGLDGVEVYHPENPPDVQEHLRQLAAQHGLIMTGGSDFHGPEADGSLLIGTVTAPPECVEQLRQRAATYARTNPG